MGLPSSGLSICTSLFTTAQAQASSFSTCLASHGVSNFSLPASTSYTTLLDFSIRNLRFTLPNVTRPAAIVLPSTKEDSSEPYYAHEMVR
uniref:Uncharacterized protein n=1 Tax=Oryza brachyantha TaxID=4533 RepID=J3MQJ6_ORYBR